MGRPPHADLRALLYHKNMGKSRAGISDRNGNIVMETMRPVVLRGRPPKVFLRDCRPGRITLDLVLPEGSGTEIYGLPEEGGGDGKGKRLLSIKKLSALLNSISEKSSPVFVEPYICADSRLVSFGGKVVADLTGREFELLASMVSNSPKILSRETIIADIWRTAAVANLVDTHIYNLRRKLPQGLAARIQSVPGKGFRYFRGC